MASRTPRVNPESTWRLYSALAAAAGVRRAVRVDDPRVLAGVVRGGSGDLAVLVNSSDDAVEVDPVVEDGAELALPEGGLELGPFAVATCALAAGTTTVRRRPQDSRVDRRPIGGARHSRRREGCDRLTRSETAACDRRAGPPSTTTTREEARERHGNQEGIRRYGGVLAMIAITVVAVVGAGGREREPLRVASALADAVHERQPVVAEQRPEPGEELGLRHRARRLRLRDAVPLRPAEGHSSSRGSPRAASGRRRRRTR